MKAPTALEVLKFEAFGVNIEIICNDSNLIKKIREVLPKVIPDKLIFKTDSDPEHIFKLHKIDNTDKFSISKNGEQLFTYRDETRLIEYLSSQIRITVAEFAKDKVFLHAGAVSWNGYGIIIPGKSYSGKTTLVSELIRKGAEYYSDEYAVLDGDGLLHPYAKMLSMRGIINDFDQLDTEPAHFGATIGKKPIPVKLVLLTAFEKNAVWEPEILKPGEAVMEILKDTIPIRYNPEFVLNVLKNIVKNAIITSSKRGEAVLVIPQIINFLETFLEID